MSSRIRLNVSLLLLALVAALALAACGGGGSSSQDVPEGAIAVVGDKTVTKAQFDQLIEAQKKSAEAKKQTFPAVGTPEYEAVKATVVKGLVEEREWELEGESMGIKVSDNEVAKRRPAEAAVLPGGRAEVPGRARQAGAHRPAGP